MKPADGASRFIVDPKCRGLIEDLKKVTWARDSHGNVRDTLSKRDPKLTHLSDALGYLIWVLADGARYGEMAGLMR